MHTFSVVIATRNRQALLGSTLKALAAQAWPAGAVEVIVADNGSTDCTRAVVADAAAQFGGASLRYLFVPEPGKSAAVNRALALASGDLIAFTDDDVCPDRTWLARMATAFDETGADFVAGRVHPVWESAPPPWLSPAVYGVIAVPDNGPVRKPIDGPGADVVPIGANMAVRRSVIERIGGLRTDLGKLEGTLRTGEDHEFFLRMLGAGCRGVYEPSAEVHHRVGRERLERSYFRRWLFQNGRDVAHLSRTYTPLDGPRAFRVPRYLYREALMDLLRFTRAVLAVDPAARFSAVGRLCWFAGFALEAWRPVPTPAGPTQGSPVSHAG